MFLFVGYRRSLFRSSSILGHNEGSGPIAFVHKRKTAPVTPVTGSRAQCTSYFIEPVRWMEPALLGVMDGQVRTHFISCSLTTSLCLVLSCFLNHILTGLLLNDFLSEESIFLV